MKTNPTGVRLSSTTIAQLDKAIERPRYDRTKLRPHTVHIGVGGFHRAHQAVYLDDLLQRKILHDWGECGVGILPRDTAMRDALREQDYLYTVLERSAEAKEVRVVGSIIDFSLATEGVGATIERLAHEDTRLVTLTITEGGYFLNEGTGDFLHNHPSIQHDVQHALAPTTSLGVLTAALDRRRVRGMAPFTVMSCDNLQGNGHVARKVLLGLAEMQDRTLHRWIMDNVAFPNSMVDRITPATTASDRVEVSSILGMDDAWPVVTEPFLQWVIEDTFCNARPPWEEVGAEIVTDVLPYELMKMRLLNASHLAMAYLGALAGTTFAHEIMQDSVFADFIEAFMEEVTPVVPHIPHTSIPAYKSTLIQRFSNPTINDQVARLCSEGSAKIPKWVLPSIVELAELGRSTRLLTLVVAGWMRYLQSPADEMGSAIEVVDAQAEQLKQVVRTVGVDPEKFIALRSIFGSQYFSTPTFTKDVGDALKELSELGVRETIRRFTAGAKLERPA